MDSIQFQTAEFADNTPKCSACKTAIPCEFYQLAGHNICSNCAGVVRRHQELPSMAAFSRGLLYGAGAAVACFTGYTMILIATGMELGIIAIGVGYLVGRAVRKGSNGLGGRRSQIAAVLLTYFAITFSDVAMIYYAFSGVALQFPALTLLRFGLIGPFEDLTSVSGLLGLVILSFGLLQAWRITARDERALTGPFQREEAVPVGG